MKPHLAITVRDASKYTGKGYCKVPRFPSCDEIADQDNYVSGAELSCFMDDSVHSYT